MPIKECSHLTTSTHFSAAHLLAHPDLSYEENSETASARPNGHGHNYHIEVTVKGKLSHVLG